MAPVFIALGLGAGILDLRVGSPILFWLGLGCLALGLTFARYTRQLLGNVFADGNS
jgi:hypothetical protein